LVDILENRVGGSWVLFDFLSREPKTVELFGYSIAVIPGWWTLIVVPAGAIFLMWAIFRDRN
jgi:hypothetical protein